MIQEINISRKESDKVRKELKKDGWLSAHYFTRRGVNVDKLRSLAKKGEIDAKILVTDGYTTTWYYKDTDVEKLKSRISW